MRFDFYVTLVQLVPGFGRPTLLTRTRFGRLVDIAAMEEWRMEKTSSPWNPSARILNLRKKKQTHSTSSI